MARAGNGYTVALKEAHLGWGTFRSPTNRDPRDGEAYIPIPAGYAREYNLVNSNGTNGRDVLGENLFRCTSADGLFSCLLRAQGSSGAGVNYAKQFSADKDLRALGEWYRMIGAQVGDVISVTWESDTDIVIEKL